MSLVRTIKFHGAIVVNGEEKGVAETSLNLFNDGRRKWADGQITGDPDDLEAAFGAGGFTLRLENGVEIDLIMSRLNGRATSASVKASGAVPGL